MEVKTKRIILFVLMAMQSLILGLCVSQVVQGNAEAFLPLLFALFSVFVLVFLWLSTFDKENIRSTEEIIDDCWKEHEQKKKEEAK